ncbi:MAG: hypothetical protein IKK79_04960 [Spirochaetaceae bacterium]|nr:hypothetical protein [Spirochaetaceae bacterium]MBR6566144.1 hypothetical protein [Spirochaetaceae bacterium]
MRVFDYSLLFPNNLSTPHDEFPKNSLNKGIGVFYHEKKMVAIQDAYHFQKEGKPWDKGTQHPVPP